MSIRPSSSLVRTLVVCAGGAAVIAGWARPAHADILVAWGDDTLGALGGGVVSSSPRANALPVINLGRLPAGGHGRLGDAFCSDLHMAIQDGALYRWGAIYLGADQNGDGVYGPGPIPTVVPGLESGVTLIGTQGYAVKDGSLYKFTTYASIFPQSPPQLVAGAPTGITAFSVSDFTGVKLAMRDGGLWSWGSNMQGQLGDNSPISTVARTTPTPIPTLTSRVTDFAAADWHCVALKDGIVYTWGTNFNGALGQGLPANGPDYPVVRTPTPVAGLLGEGGATAIAVGAHHTLAVRNGFVYSWGWNSVGQLGYPGSSVNAPAQVPGLHNIVAVSAFRYSSFALSADGTIWSWGGNSSLSLGHAFSGPTPHQVLPPAGYRFTGVRAGGGFTLATIAPACAADFGSAGGVFGPDGQLDNNDLIAFIDIFFAQDPMADMGEAGGVPGPDGAFDNNDFIVFIERFFGGC